MKTAEMLHECELCHRLVDFVVWDHCHKDGDRLRGRICLSCNSRLGVLEKTGTSSYEEWVERAHEYLSDPPRDGSYREAVKTDPNTRDHQIERVVSKSEIGRVKGARPTTRAVSVSEAAQILGIARATAYRDVESGSIPSVRIGTRIVIPLDALMAKFGMRIIVCADCGSHNFKFET